MILYYKYDLEKIVIFPFGGISIYNALLNSSIKDELFIMIMGPLFQIIFTCFIYFLYTLGFVNIEIYSMMLSLSIMLLSFNLLPIIPLDGSRLVSLVLECFFPYKISILLNIIISIISICVVLIFCDRKLLIIFLLLLLLFKIYEAFKLRNVIFNKFVMERYIYRLKLKKGKDINSIYNIKRGKTHDIIKYNTRYNEKDYLDIFYLTRRH